MDNQQLINRLKTKHDLSNAELTQLLTTLSNNDKEYLFAAARTERERIYGKDVYVRGLIEFSNICKNDCYYCGIRKSNTNINRYRLTPEEILACANEGYELGFRTVVLQGGEDAWFTKERLANVISNIKKSHSDMAITLSVGERDVEEYRCWKEAGADRYLLRHETAEDEHYHHLHPKEMRFENRKRCLFALRELGYQVGAGMMIGSPGQTMDCLLADIRFLQELQPHMIGIGPFLAHSDTPFGKEPDGSLELTLVLLAILRLLFPSVLLPATTALGTIAKDGRERGLLAGANVLMPNLSPVTVRKDYELYNNKICTGTESAQCRDCLSQRVESTGYHIVVSRGDSKVSET